MKFFSYKKSLKIKKRIACVLALAVLITTFLPNGDSVFAFLKGEKIFASQTQQELNQVENEIEALEEEQEAIEEELEEKMEELTALLADKAILENDMVVTQAAIDQAKIDLESAKTQEAEEYEAMKRRIQYMYENSTQNSIIDAVLNANGITDLLNRVEYVSQVHKTDRELLEEYKAVVEEVETLAAELDANMNDLLSLQEVYEHQEVELENVLAELEEKSDNYEAQIARAERRAEELADEIEAANSEIADQTPGGGGDTSQNPGYVTGVSGEQVVSFALQYVGYPYRYGGNSLTNGCDCSGFVNLVFKNFGIKVPRQSYAFRTCGQAVSFGSLRAGDIVVYPGHVAIYIGNGNIVEAQSTRAGITCNRKVTCNTIVAMRRVL